MRLAKRVVVTSVALAVTAGVMGGSIMAAHADEKPAPPVAAVASSAPGIDDTTVPEGDLSGPPSADAQDDPLSDNGVAFDPNSDSDVTTLALPRICNHLPKGTQGVAFRAWCFWLSKGLPHKRVNINTDLFHLGVTIWTGGGQFFNRDHKLPVGGNHMYMEYDMKEHFASHGRDANRIVIDIMSGMKYYTVDHYRTFIPFG